MIVLFVEQNVSKFSMLIIPPVVMCILRIQIFMIDKLEIECHQLVNFIMVVSRVFLTVAVTCVCLKLDGYSSWSWGEVFWWYWVFLSICVGTSIALLLITLSKLYVWLWSGPGVKLYEVKALLWCSSVSLCLTIASSLWATSSVQLLEESNMGADTMDFKYFILYLFLGVHTLMFSLTSYFWARDIIQFIQQWISSDQQLAESPQVQSQRNETQTKKTLPAITEKLKKHRIPKVLKKVSSTYYGVANKQEQHELHIEQEKKERQQELKSQNNKRRTNLDNGSTELMLQQRVSASSQRMTQIEFNQQKIESGQHNELVMSKSFQKKEKISVPDIIDFESELPSEDSIRLSPIKHAQKQQNELNLKTVIEEHSLVILDNDKASEHQSYKRIENQLSQSFNALPQNKVLKSKKSGSPDNQSMQEVRIDQNRCQEKEAELSMSQNNQSVMNCLVCFDRQPDAVFMNCGHGGICYNCALDVWKNSNECYLCREKILQVLQLDLNSKSGPYLKVISSTQMVEE